MKIIFAKQDPRTIIGKIAKALGGPKLHNLVSFNLEEDFRLEVTIKKAGTSFLAFDYQENADDICWQLCDQKIAFSHLPFKTTIFEQIKKAVARHGGRVVEKP